MITRAHPDKGGDAVTFARIQRAYDVLSDDAKRASYDETGTFEKTVEEELLDEFGGGVLRDKMKEEEARKESLAEALVKTEKEKGSHTAGFEAWLRARGPDSNKTIGVEDMIDRFGVNKGSYDEVVLPKIRAYQASVTAAKTLASRAKFPFVAGSDGVATVVKVGAGVKSLNEGDWVLPYKAEMGTWRSLAVWKEKDLIKLPSDILPMEYAAMMREMCVAYRLLEDFGSLKPGDAVVLNAATSTVGQCVVQLCAMLKLRAIDAVGGASAVRLAESLQPGCPLIVYGNMSGRAATFPWHAWTQSALIVRGFSLRQWMTENKKKVPKMMETLGKLARADKLAIQYTDYELSSEFEEALEHAREDDRCTKVLLRVNDIGTTYDSAENAASPTA